MFTQSWLFGWCAISISTFCSSSGDFYVLWQRMETFEAVTRLLLFVNPPQSMVCRKSLFDCHSWSVDWSELWKETIRYVIKISLLSPLSVLYTHTRLYHQVLGWKSTGDRKCQHSWSLQDLLLVSGMLSMHILLPTPRPYPWHSWRWIEHQSPPFQLDKPFVEYSSSNLHSML